MSSIEWVKDRGGIRRKNKAIKNRNRKIKRREKRTTRKHRERDKGETGRRKAERLTAVDQPFRGREDGPRGGKNSIVDEDERSRSM